MKFTTETRRKITEDEKQRGLQWLKDNGFEEVIAVPDRLELWRKQLDDRRELVVLKPHSCWSVHVYRDSDEIFDSFAEYSDVSEVVDAAMKRVSEDRLLNKIFNEAPTRIFTVKYWLKQSVCEDVEAHSEEEAKEIMRERAEAGEFPLYDMDDDGTGFEIIPDEEQEQPLPETEQPLKKFNVGYWEHRAVFVEIEAHSEKEAEEIMSNRVDNAEFVDDMELGDSGYEVWEDHNETE